jgi:TonB family protein
VTLTAAPAAGQSSEQVTPRKVLYKQNPSYPVALREARIGGIVRLEIAISPRGTVETVLPLGGNPVLVEAAAAAVKKWKYAPADSETRTQLVFTFDPRR